MGHNGPIILRRTCRSLIGGFQVKLDHLARKVFLNLGRTIIRFQNGRVACSPSEAIGEDCVHVSKGIVLHTIIESVLTVRSLTLRSPRSPEVF